MCHTIIWRTRDHDCYMDLHNRINNYLGFTNAKRVWTFSTFPHREGVEFIFHIVPRWNSFILVCRCWATRDENSVKAFWQVKSHDREISLEEVYLHFRCMHVDFALPPRINGVLDEYVLISTWTSIPGRVWKLSGTLIVTKLVTKSILPFRFFFLALLSCNGTSNSFVC